LSFVEMMLSKLASVRVRVIISVVFRPSQVDVCYCRLPIKLLHDDMTG